MKSSTPTHISMFYRGTILHLISTRILINRVPCAGELVPYISLAADVCKINSTVFPSLGSMMHSKVSGWLCGNGEKQMWEGAGSSRYTGILRDKTRGEFGIAYFSIARDIKTSGDWCYCEPYIHISKHPAGTYTCTYIRTTWLVQVWKHLPTSKAKDQ